MSSDRISSTPPLAETLRALARERTGKAGRKSTGTESGGGGHPKVEGRPAIGQLRERLSSLARGIDVNDGKAINAIRNNALREILLWEFGNDFRNDSQFLPMVEAIGKAMDTDAEYRQRFTELLVGLQRKS
jgi:hypothetical protein